MHARGLTLGIIATVAFVFGLQWAKNFFVPLLLGIFLAYTLSPVVRTFVLATAAVPIVIYGLMPHLHKLRVRILTRATR